MNKNKITQFDRRLIEAEVYANMFTVLLEKFGKDESLEILKEILTKNAFEAGKQFAKSTDRPSLEHFSTVINRWQEGGAIETDPLELDGNILKVKVKRCRYQEEYRQMGLPAEIIPVISCCRDEPFAKGYDERISMERETTLASDGDCCPFIFKMNK